MYAEYEHSNGMITFFEKLFKKWNRRGWFEAQAGTRSINYPYDLIKKWWFRVESIKFCTVHVYLTKNLKFCILSPDSISNALLKLLERLAEKLVCFCNVGLNLWLFSGVFFWFFQSCILFFVFFDAIFVVISLVVVWGFFKVVFLCLPTRSFTWLSVRYGRVVGTVGFVAVGVAEVAWSVITVCSTTAYVLFGSLETVETEVADDEEMLFLLARGKQWV